MFKNKHAMESLDLGKEMQRLILLAGKEYYNVREACEALGVSRTTLYVLRKLGKLESKLIGRKKVVIPKWAIDNLINQAPSAS